MALEWRVRAGAFEVRPPRPWSTVRLAETGVLANFDLSSDGRILALLAGPTVGEPAESLSVTLNFFEEFEKRSSR